jgi:hypothetical protein
VLVPQQSSGTDCARLILTGDGNPTGHMITDKKVLVLDPPRHLMNAYTHFTNATACCAFCVKPLPIVNGELQPWRAASGQFFCNEFCADDAEEARFHSHRREDRKANNLSAST